MTSNRRMASRQLALGSRRNTAPRRGRPRGHSPRGASAPRARPANPETTKPRARAFARTRANLRRAWTRRRLPATRRRLRATRLLLGHHRDRRHPLRAAPVIIPAPASPPPARNAPNSASLGNRASNVSSTRGRPRPRRLAPPQVRAGEHERGDVGRDPRRVRARSARCSAAAATPRAYSRARRAWTAPSTRTREPRATPTPRGRRARTPRRRRRRRPGGLGPGPVPVPVVERVHPRRGAASTRARRRRRPRRRSRRRSAPRHGSVAGRSGPLGRRTPRSRRRERRRRRRRRRRGERRSSAARRASASALSRDDASVAGRDSSHSPNPSFVSSFPSSASSGSREEEEARGTPGVPAAPRRTRGFGVVVIFPERVPPRVAEPSPPRGVRPHHPPRDAAVAVVLVQLRLPS